MNGFLVDAGHFLIKVIFGFVILMVMLRFLLQLVRADFYNPLSQFVVKLTTPLLKPLRRLIPGYGGIDFAAVVVMVALQLIEYVLILALLGKSMSVVGLLVFALIDLAQLAVMVFIVTIFVQVILSWIQPGGYNPMLAVIHQLSAPVLRPFQRLIPPFSGIDLSPMVALIVLFLVRLALEHLRSAGL